MRLVRLPVLVTIRQAPFAGDGTVDPREDYGQKDSAKGEKSERHAPYNGLDRLRFKKHISGASSPRRRRASENAKDLKLTSNSRWTAFNDLGHSTR